MHDSGYFMIDTVPTPVKHLTATDEFGPSDDYGTTLALLHTMSLLK